MKLCVALALLVGFLIAADAKDDSTKKDSEKLQGTWIVVAGEQGGKKFSDQLLKDIGSKWTFAGGKVLIQDGALKIQGSYKLDATKKPKTIDLTLQKPEGANGPPTVVVQGIYELDGIQLRLCMTDKERPKAFTAKDPDCRLLTFRRDHATKKNE